jgi:hypothetical protein
MPPIFITTQIQSYPFKSYLKIAFFDLSSENFTNVSFVINSHYQKAHLLLLNISYFQLELDLKGNRYKYDHTFFLTNNGEILYPGQW